MTEKFLDKAYGLDNSDDTSKLYDEWAASYDAEVAENGYATPGRAAAALFEKLPEPDAPILDFGCGTGLSGLALTLAGYRVIDGMDPSSEMLEGARRKGVYRSLTPLDVSDETPIGTNRYKAITAIGVIGTGAAPAATLNILMNALGSGDLLCFSYNDHALADPIYESTLNSWLDCGAARLLTRSYGDHLPARGIKANVYVLEKA